MKPLTYTRDAKLVTSFKFESVIRGVVVVGRDLYVIVDGSDEVRVHNAIASEFRTSFSVEGLSNPYSIIATDQCLFISNYDDSSIYRVDIPNCTTVSSWEIGIRYNRLSMAKHGNILVTSCDANALCEYTPTGTLLRTVELPSEMHGPRHAIQLDDDRFLVTHEMERGSPALNRVCVIDIKGQLIASYGGIAGSGLGQLNKPRQLAVDRNGFIYVACVEDNKVPLLNSKLEFVKYIIPSSTGINHIFMIYLDEQRGKLYVSDFDKDTLSVFQLN